MEMVYILEAILGEFERSRGTVAHNWLEPEMSRASPTALTAWAAFGEILRHPWFGRIWVIQEVAVGQPPLLVCGNRAVDWDALCFVVFKILENGFQHLARGSAANSSDPPPNLPHGLPNLTVMQDARYLQQNGEHESLQLTLLGMYHFNATDPRDKIFAVLGLADDIDDEPLRPNYEETTEQVYHKTALHLLLRDPSIDILHKAGVGYPRHLTNILSWVPDWTSEAFLEFSSRVRTGGFRAAGDSFPNVQRTSSTDSIAIDGLRVDVIDKMTMPRPTAPLGGNAADIDSYRVEDYRWLSEVEAIVDYLKNSPAEQLHEIVRSHRSVLGVSWNEALWRTLIANSTYSAIGIAPPEYGQYFEAWRQVVINAHLNRDRRLENFKESAAFNTACVNATEQRRFFCTKSGFIGLTAPATAVGDIVVIFLGGEAPFVIRENEFSDTYTLVGGAYVHDIMYAEAMRSDGIETFVLT
jgi:hypothetical protein